MDVIVFVIVLPLLVIVGVPLAVVGLWWGHREVQQQRKLDIGKEEEK